MRLLAHNDGRELRGNERQLLLLARGLAARGHEVVVSCREGAPLARELGQGPGAIAATSVRPRGDFSLPSALRFRRLIRERRPDAVLLASWKRLFVASWAARGAFGGAPTASGERAGVASPRVVARLGLVRRMAASGWSAWKLRHALERVDALVVNSDAVKAAWLDSAPWFPPDRLHVIPNAVAPAVASDPTSLRRELGLAPDIRIVAAVASLEPRKGIDLLLRALVELPHDVHAVIAGDGPERARLHALARSLVLDARVHWLGARADVGKVLAASAVVAVPSRTDSLPNALLEALAAGVPVVATEGIGAEGALQATADRPAAGRIVRQEDPHALAAGLAAVLAVGAPEPGTPPSGPSQEALFRAAHWFSPERMVAAYERVLFGSR